MALKDAKYDGNGGLWVNRNSHGNTHPVMQGSMQIGGRTIALTIWKGKGNPAPDFNISVNDQKTSFEDMIWFKALSPTDKPSSNVRGKQADVLIVDDLAPADDDIPF